MDEYLMHEATDRTYLAFSFIAENLMDHEGFSEEEMIKVTIAHDILFELYGDIIERSINNK